MTWNRENIIQMTAKLHGQLRIYIHPYYTRWLNSFEESICLSSSSLFIYFSVSYGFLFWPIFLRHSEHFTIDKAQTMFSSLVSFSFSHYFASICFLLFTFLFLYHTPLIRHIYSKKIPLGQNSRKKICTKRIIDTVQ